MFHQRGYVYGKSGYEKIHIIYNQKMRFKTTVRYYYALVRIIKNKKLDEDLDQQGL